MTTPDFYRVSLALIVALVAFAVAFFLINRAYRPTLKITSLSLEETVSDIKQELQELENTPGPNIGLELTEVKIVLFVQEEHSRTGEAKLAVPVFDEVKLDSGETVAGQAGSKVTVVLVPPKGSQVLSAERGGTIQFANLLTVARQALYSSVENEPKLEAKAIEVEVAFVLTAKRSDNASVEVRVISAGVATERKNSSSNTVTLRYLNPKFQKPDLGLGIVPP